MSTQYSTHSAARQELLRAFGRFRSAVNLQGKSKSSQALLSFTGGYVPLEQQRSVLGSALRLLKLEAPADASEEQKAAVIAFQQTMICHVLEFHSSLLIDALRSLLKRKDPTAWHVLGLVLQVNPRKGSELYQQLRRSLSADVMFGSAKQDTLLAAVALDSGQNPSNAQIGIAYALKVDPDFVEAGFFLMDKPGLTEPTKSGIQAGLQSRAINPQGAKAFIAKKDEQAQGPWWQRLIRFFSPNSYPIKTSDIVSCAREGIDSKNKAQVSSRLNVRGAGMQPDQTASNAKSQSKGWGVSGWLQKLGLTTSRADVVASDTDSASVEQARQKRLDARRRIAPPVQENASLVEHTPSAGQEDEVAASVYSPSAGQGADYSPSAGQEDRAAASVYSPSAGQGADYSPSAGQEDEAAASVYSPSAGQGAGYSPSAGQEDKAAAAVYSPSAGQDTEGAVNGAPTAAYSPSGGQLGVSESPVFNSLRSEAVTPVHGSGGERRRRRRPAAKALPQSLGGGNLFGAAGGKVAFEVLLPGGKTMKADVTGTEAAENLRQAVTAGGGRRG